MTEQDIKRIWEKGIKIEGLDPDLYRKDVAGALMIFTKFNDHTDEYGWSIDHIYPIAMGGDDNPVNLRPMHIENIRSKGSDFPVYFRVRKMDGTRNIIQRGQCRIGTKLLETIKTLYGYNG
ncbi:MAG: HNH endonuclease [Muribaculaceae bacterium]|nr:HNH endonuclease [Muribaculaceae bacterium]